MILALFIVYHLLHLTVGVVGFQPGEFHHLKVYDNVVAGFSVWYVSLFYILSMAALCLHLDHGVWSMFQTLGLNNARMSPALRDRVASGGARGVRRLYLGAGGRAGRLGYAEGV